MAIFRRIAGIMIVLALITPAHAAHAQTPAPAPCAAAAAAALSARGFPYVWGSKGPTAFDCSGLVHWAWAQAGYDVGVSSYDQARQGVEIPCTLANLAGSSSSCWQAGDLIFLRYIGGQHVAMYIGSGLFADAYNAATGVIVHDPSADAFYQAHFWQARRIVSCNGVTINPGTASSPTSTPGLEDIPGIVTPVAFSVAQCGTCNADGSSLLPETQWDGHWPTGTDAINLPLVFQTVISWLAWRISDLLRILICWLLSMLAILAAFLTTFANSIIIGINGVWKILIFLWFSFQAWFLSIYYLMIDLLSAIGAGIAILSQILSIMLLVISISLEMMVRVLGMLGLIVRAILGLLGWVGGMTIGMFSAILLALSGTAVPTQLVDSSPIYFILRGSLEAIRDSSFGWLLYLMWGMAYVGAVYWLSRFMSNSKQERD